MKPFIRPAHAADAESMAQIDALVSPSPWPQSRFAAACGEQPAVQALVADSSSGLCGFLVFSRILDEASIQNLAVSPTRQRQGVASKLLSAAVAAWAESGVARLLLEVRASNHAALALYQRFGFVRDGLRADYYPCAGGREDALLMSRYLGETG